MPFGKAKRNLKTEGILLDMVMVLLLPLFVCCWLRFFCQMRSGIVELSQLMADLLGTSVRSQLYILTTKLSLSEFDGKFQI